MPSATGLASVTAIPFGRGLPLGGPLPLASSGSVVYTPSQIRHAYGFDQLPYDGSGQTIAIVDAYDDPTILSDLRAFDNIFGLSDPPSFVKAMPGGHPAVNGSWAGEISLDVEWVHAIAPGANILLVEAASNSGADLLNAVNYARQQPGVVAVSMSWGSTEFTGEATLDSYFTTPQGHTGGSGLAGGITFVASTGDSGASGGPEWPSVSPNVLAAGGTSLFLSGGNYAGEVAWSGGGGGISTGEPRPYFQRTVQGSGSRETPDVSYDADPNTGFYVYDTTAYNGSTGWFVFGGTSAAAPQWAALIALADQGRALNGRASLTNAQSTLYSLPASDFHDITAGSNGYGAGRGYDLATGIGSPVANRIVPDLVAANNGIVFGFSGVAPQAGGTTNGSRGGSSGPVRRGDGGTGSVGGNGDFPRQAVFALFADPQAQFAPPQSGVAPHQPAGSTAIEDDQRIPLFAGRVSLELATLFYRSGAAPVQLDADPFAGPSETPADASPDVSAADTPDAS